MRVQARPPRLVRRSLTPSWHLLFTAVLVAGAIALLLYAQWQSRPLETPPLEEISTRSGPPAADAPSLADTLFARAEAILEEVGIWPGLVHKSRGRPDRIEVQVPTDLPLAVVNWHLTRFVEDRGGQVLAAVEKIPGQRVEMRCGFHSAVTTLFALEHKRGVQRPTGRIAIVIDDLGRPGRDEILFERFCALSPPLTFAVLPHEGRAAAIAEAIRQRGHEVILHLPMEPDDPDSDPGRGAILTSHSDEEIRRLLHQALRQVPAAKGVNNHMGSKATADPRVMALVLGELKRRGLFFLDSRTSPNSAIPALAAEMGLPALSRDLFIDEVDEIEAIQARLWELAELAARNGQAIGIGHYRRNTLLALEALLPRLEARGFSFVSLSRLVR